MEQEELECVLLSETGHYHTSRRLGRSQLCVGERGTLLERIMLHCGIAPLVCAGVIRPPCMELYLTAVASLPAAVAWKL